MTPRCFADFVSDESGATAVEYGLIVGLIVVTVLGGLTAVADANSDTYEMLESELVIG